MDNSHYSKKPEQHIPARQGLLALSPVGVFLLLYVAVSVAAGDFYKVPVSVALTASSVWAVAIYRRQPLMRRIEVFSAEAGHSNILYMIWVFVLAGAFASVAREIGSVDSTVNFTLSHFPTRFVVPAMFFSSCFISFSIGTSVGTVVALTPLAVDISTAAGGPTAFFVAVVLGGAFFGDNLSFISDTTIAATRSQGCDMRSKFRANLWIAIPAALATIAIYTMIGSNTPEAMRQGESDPWLIAPYMIVILAAIAGINVTLVLLAGIISAIITGLCSGHSMTDLAGFMGAGIESMGSLIIITLLAAGMLGVIKAAGGIRFLLQQLSSGVKGLRGAQWAIVTLVSLVNLCTANNTVAIITVGGIARDISERFGVDPRKTASLLDSASCIVQCLIPYGAQTLLATGLAGISPAAPFRYLYYPWALAAMVALSVIFLFPKSLNRRHQS